VDDEVLAARRAAMEARGEQAWKPVGRERPVSQALRAYAAMTHSAARGAVRDHLAARLRLSVRGNGARLRAPGFAG